MQTRSINIQVSCRDDFESGILTVDEARRKILNEIQPIEDFEKLALRAALGRVLAQDVISPINVPSHTNSAMDGYALSGSELLSGLREFDCIGTAYAGTPFENKNQPGQCVRIMTGAAIPAGTDTVVMQEQAEVVSGDRIIIHGEHRVGQNVRQAGEDISVGNVVLQIGHSLKPADLGVLASLGIGEIRVSRRPRVAFFSTGDELRSIGEPLADGEIYDSNRYSLYGMLKRLDVEILDLGVIRDDPLAIRDAFESAAKMADVVITSGGVSVGEADYIKTVLDEIGDINFWKIAMKPGRPITFGHLGNALFFGLPGNPVAVMVTFYQFVQPALNTLSGGKHNMPFTHSAICQTLLRKRPGRYEFVRGILTQNQQGQLEVTTTGKQGSGILMSMSHANCFILLPENSSDIQPGDTVMVQTFESFV